MKRILIALALLLPFSAIAQDRYDVPQTGTKVGLTRTGINSNFTFLFIAGTNSFRTAVEKGSNINFVGKSPTNATQLDYCFTNTTADGNTPQGPWTNSVGGAGFALTGADYAQFTNQTFIRVGTNLLSAQGWPNVTNVAWNGASLINPADGNTPQSPLTNTLAMAGFAATGGDYLQVTNQTAFRVGTNLLAVQGWPDATNIAWNGAALINVSGSGGGGAYAYQGTNNIAPTNANGNTIAANAISSRIGGGTNNVIGGTRFSTIAGGRNNTISNMDTFGEAFIGGGSGNTIGGTPSEPGWWGVIGGGRNNVMNGDRSAILGGENNVVGDQAFYSSILAAFACSVAAGASYNSILGGANCTIGANSSYCTLGGEQNIIGANIGRNTMPGGSNNQIYNPADYATISGGGANYVVADYTTIGGGQANTIAAGATHSTVGGGNGNDIGASATYATVGGGNNNDIGSGATYSTIAGGLNGMIGANVDKAFIGGGANNRIDGTSDIGVIGGGSANGITNSPGAIIGGGEANWLFNAPYAAILAGELNDGTGTLATVIGGWHNHGNGFGSVVAGQYGRAMHDGVFVYSDGQSTNAFSSTATNQFLIRASGGVKIASHGGGQDTNTWSVTGMRIVTNADVFIHTPAWQGCQLLDVGSNRIYYAVGLTTNDWKGTNLN